MGGGISEDWTLFARQVILESLAILFMASRSQFSFVLRCLVVLAAAGSLLIALVQRNEVSKLRQDVQRLRDENHQIQRQQAQNSSLSQRQLQNEEIQRRQSENLELLRLRNEVRQLREQKTELQAVRVENAKLLVEIADLRVEVEIAKRKWLLQRSEEFPKPWPVLPERGAWLGLNILSANDPKAEVIPPTITEGVVITSIHDYGPASQSDLKPLDIIVAVDGQPVSNVDGLKNEMRGKAAGKIVVLDVLRNSIPLQMAVRSGEWSQNKYE